MTVERTLRFLKSSAVVLLSAHTLLWIALALMRLLYPFEVEWMEGSMMDHGLRILQHHPIYAAPSVEFVAWLYPPVYYYALACMFKMLGVGWFGARLLSILSTFGTSIMLGAIVRRLTGRTWLALITSGLYLATYRATGFYFDIVRNDAFFVFLLVCTLYAALRFPDRKGAVLCAFLLTLSFFTKQQALLFVPAFAGWYWLRSRSSGIVVLLGTVTSIAILLVAGNRDTNGWLSYYLFTIPGAKRADFSTMRAIGILPEYLLSTFAAVTLALIARVLLDWKLREWWQSGEGLIALGTGAAIVAGALSLGNEGGYRNVMMPFAAFGIPSLALLIYRLEALRPDLLPWAYGMIVFQSLALAYNPLSQKMLIASNTQRQGGELFVERLRAIRGEVQIPYHGFVGLAAGKVSHAHILAMMDVFRVKDTSAHRLESDLDSCYRSQRFAAIILEESNVLGSSPPPRYRFAGRMVARSNIGLIRVADDVTRPEFLFLPDSSGR